MGKKCGGYVPITEHAPRAAERVRKAREASERRYVERHNHEGDAA